MENKKDEEIKLLDLKLYEFYSFSSKFSSLIAAHKIELFEYLNSTDYKSIPEIKKALDLGIEERNLLDFLDVLYVNKHLLREGLGLEAKYKNRHNFFVKSNSNNVICMINMFERKMKRQLSLDYILKSGKGPNDVSIFEELYSDPDKAESFLKTMGLIQNNHFNTIIENLDLSNYKTALDVGGCLGNFLVKLKKKYENIECSNLDLPVVQEYFNKYLKENDMENKVKFIVGDFFINEFPKTDIVIMGNILHDWNHDEKLKLTQKAYDSLNEGGVFIAIENFVSENRDKLEDGLNGSFNMLVECVKGFDMTRKEFEFYCLKSGFSKVDFLMERMNCDGAICYK
jgi:SAM-dependent methyltransferase